MLKKVDGFIVSLVGMIIFAWFLPEFALHKGMVSLDKLTDIGVSFIFFFYGLKLSPRQMKDGLYNYKLHLVVQLSTFVLFPLLVIIILPFIHSDKAHLLWLGLFFLAALPSTVSSSVVMVVLAKGNMAGAIFNASISGLLGILLTPIWMGVFMNAGPESFSFFSVMLSLVVKILLPVIIGLALHRFWGHLAKKHSKALSRFDKTIILAIVYNSFSKSFSAGIFNSIGLIDLLLLGFAVVILFIVVYIIIGQVAKMLAFNREDRITALFCGSKKSLVHGTVISKVLFNGMSSQGIFILPIMIYHAFQLIVISFIAQKKGKERTSD